MQKLALQPGEAVLEIGSGNGILARDLVQAVGANGSVKGLDNADTMIATARKISPQAEFVLGSAEVLPFDDNTFDAAVGAQVLCFLDRVETSLAETFRVLKPGGRAAFLETDWATLVWRSGYSDLMDRIFGDYTSHYTDPYLPRTLGEKLGMAGFRPVDTDSFVIVNTDFGEDTYARQTANFAVPLMENSDRFHQKEITDWLEEQHGLSTQGGFFFSLNRYVFLAHKPA
jgi:SAM-dependent methyltransferase